MVTGLAGAAVVAGGEVVARNPAVAGGFTLFVVVLAYVSANALWYQSQPRGDVILMTRPSHVFHAAEGVPATSNKRSGAAGKTGAQATQAAPAPDPVVAQNPDRAPRPRPL